MNARLTRHLGPGLTNASLIALFTAFAAAAGLVFLTSGCDRSGSREASRHRSPGPYAAAGSFDEAATRLEKALDTGDLSSVTLPIRSFQAYRPASTEQVRRAHDLVRRYNALVETSATKAGR